MVDYADSMEQHDNSKWKDISNLKGVQFQHKLIEEGVYRIFHVRTITTYRWLPYDKPEKQGPGRWQKLDVKGRWVTINGFPDEGDIQEIVASDSYYAEGCKR
jgi:hypothetical protein